MKISSGLRDEISRQYFIRASKQFIGFEDRAAAEFNRMRYAVKKTKSEYTLNKYLLICFYKWNGTWIRIRMKLIRSVQLQKIFSFEFDFYRFDLKVKTIV